MRINPLPTIAAALLAVNSVEPPTTDSPTSTDGVPLSVETMAGIWHLESFQVPGGPAQRTQGLLMAIEADGTIAVDNYGDLVTSPYIVSRYELDGDVIVFLGGCGQDLRAVIPEDGRLHTVIAEPGIEGCGNDIPVGVEWSWIRVSPSSPAGEALSTPGDAFDNPYSPSDTPMAGTWLRQGSGQLLHLGDFGDYAIDDGGLLGIDPDDTGAYEIDGDTITFTSDGSATCTAGDIQLWESVVLDDVRLHEDLSQSAKVLQTAGGEPDCTSHVAGDQTWLRLSP